jgi:hypothetical protein
LAGIPNNNNKYGKNAQYWIPDGNLKALNLENSVNPKKNQCRFNIGLRMYSRFHIHDEILIF